MNANFPMTIAYDMTLKRVGCAIIQAGYGATIDNFNLGRMNNWLLAPTKSTSLYTVYNAEELERVIDITNEANPGA